MFSFCYQERWPHKLLFYDRFVHDCYCVVQNYGRTAKDVPLLLRKEPSSLKKTSLSHIVFQSHSTELNSCKTICIEDLITSDNIVKSMPLPPIDSKEKPVLDWTASQKFINSFEGHIRNPRETKDLKDLAHHPVLEILFCPLGIWVRVFPTNICWNIVLKNKSTVLSTTAFTPHQPEQIACQFGNALAVHVFKMTAIICSQISIWKLCIEKCKDKAGTTLI